MLGFEVQRTPKTQTPNQGLPVALFGSSEPREVSMRLVTGRG
jgi:hypothetical protein